MSRSLLVALTIAIAPMGAVAGPLDRFSDFYVFGDSLSDPGNTLSSLSDPDPLIATIYPTNQFTDGSTWAAQLGADIASGRNFAYGAATAVSQGEIDLNLPGGPYKIDIPDLTEQIALYDASTPVLGSNPLAAVWFGANDLRDAFQADDPGTATAAAIGAAVTRIATSVQELIFRGMSTVAVFGLPDLGKIPEALAAGQDASAAATGATVAFNSTLRSALAGLTSGDVRYVDTFGLFEMVQADNTAFGFSNITSPCLDALLGGAAADCSGFLFYDTIHPTDAAHALIAAQFTAAIAPVPLPAGWVLVLSFGAILGLLRRRKISGA
jgi:phospholipase/lecithinase/hemolysin